MTAEDDQMQENSAQRVNIRRALSIYGKLKKIRDKEIEERARKAAEEPTPALEEPPIVARLRHSRDAKGRPMVDLRKADPDCPHCDGTGRRPDERIHDPETDGEMVIPRVCRCVKRNGGVRPDLLDKLMAAAAKKQRWADRRKERRKRRRQEKRSKRDAKRKARPPSN